MNAQKLSLVAIIAAAGFCSDTLYAAEITAPLAGNGRANGGLVYATEDYRLNLNDTTYENYSVSGNGGVVYSEDELYISGTGAFLSNSAGGNGGAIWGGDDIIFTGTGEGSLTFYGNSATGKGNDLYLADHDGEIVFRSGSYGFDGGLDASRGGDLVFYSAAKVTFFNNANNVIGGKTHFAKGSRVVFEEGTTNAFLGGIVVAAGHSQALGGNVRIGNEIRLGFDTQTGAYASLDLSSATSVSIDPKTRLVIAASSLANGVVGQGEIADATLIYARGTELVDTFSAGTVLLNTPFLKSETAFDGNNLVVRTTRKNTDDAVRELGGNAASAIALGDTALLESRTYDEARRYAGAVSGELVASAAHAAVARARVSASQTTRFLLNEIAGNDKPVRSGSATAFYAPRDRRVSQAATEEGVPGGEASAESLEDWGWEVALAYIGQSGDVAAHGGYNAYDYGYEAAWLAAKKAFDFGSIGVTFEFGEGNSEGASSKVRSDSWGLGAFFFLPLTDAGTYALIQGGASLGDNEFSRRPQGRNFKGNFDAWTCYVQGEAGTQFELLPRLKINPYVTLNYSAYEADSFSDGGNRYESLSFADTSVKPGLRLRSDFEIAGLKSWATLGAAWTYRFSDDAADLGVFANGTAANVRGNAGARDFAEASVDFGIALTDALNVSLGYAYANGGELESHDFYIRTGLKF